MLKAVCVSVTCLSAASLLAGCASTPVHTASDYADQGAHAIYRTGSDVYAGMGTAAKRPFQDLNMMQDPIPTVLLQAELNPYAVRGLTSCDAITNHVAELDLALGPDMDAPADRPKSKMTEDAGLAAAAALEAAAAAAEGFMPVRSVVKRVSGASKYEKHVKHAILAGMDRRAFLKAVGMMQNCGWPAAPLTVTVEAAKVLTSWGPAAVSSPLNGPSPPNMVVQVNAPAPHSPAVQCIAVQAQAGVTSAPRAYASTPAVQITPPVQTTPPVQAPAAEQPSTLASLSGPPVRTTPQGVAQPAALVSPQTGASTLASPVGYAPPAAGSAPWASPPPGSR
jgi:hypothetical protein